MKYKNPWYRITDPIYGPEFYESDHEPVEYRGFLIVRRDDSRAQAHVYDVVRHDACVSTRGGVNGAMHYIDWVLKGETDDNR